jgi:hypothetical protein
MSERRRRRDNWDPEDFPPMALASHPCPWCGEDDCDNACTGAVPGSRSGQALADEEEDEPDAE